MDPAFIDELVARLAAQDDREREIAAERARKARRKAGSYGGTRGYYEVVDVPVA